MARGTLQVSCVFVVKNIAVIEATGVVDDFEEEEEDEMSLGGGGGRSMREAYGPMGMGRYAWLWNHAIRMKLGFVQRRGNVSVLSLLLDGH